jgi:hypothetical protein
MTAISSLNLNSSLVDRTWINLETGRGPYVESGNSRSGRSGIGM